MWDKFYKNHKLGFFHHRHYLRREFPELVSTQEQKNKDKEYTLCELGCGVGDTIYPLLDEYKNIKRIYGVDFSAKAIEWVRKVDQYDPARVIVEVCDLVKDEIPKNIISTDLVTLIFCLSAISPENH